MKLNQKTVKVVFFLLCMYVTGVIVLCLYYSAQPVTSKARASKPTTLPAATKAAEPKQKFEQITTPSAFPPKQEITSESPKSPTNNVKSQPVKKDFSVPILMYHYIGENPDPNDTTRTSLSVTPSMFEEQMSYLAQNGYTTLDLNDLAAISQKNQTEPDKAIVLTFDDGYVDFYWNAFPILRNYNFKAVVFIPTDLMDQGYYLSWSQIEEIALSGLVSFEDHTLGHKDLKALSTDEIYRQLKESRDILIEKTGQPVNFVAYPYGDSNSVIWSIAQKAGFSGGVGTWAGTATNVTMNMPRYRIGGYTSIERFGEYAQY